MASAFRTIALLIAMAGAAYAQAPGTEAFLTQLQRASQANDRNAIAALIRYARTGAPLGARASVDGRFVSGRPSEDGDYRIEARRTLTLR